jgi:hypothetical protein
MKDWKFKYKLNAICSLEKQTGEVVQVRIEGVVCSRHTDWQPLYDVREVVGGKGYPVCESNLRTIKT